MKVHSVLVMNLQNAAIALERVLSLSDALLETLL